MEDLWPDFDEMPNVSTPGTILKEQALALGEKFQNKIIGNVASNKEGVLFTYWFRLACPSLGYRYGLFKVSYSMIDLYPVTVSVMGDIAEDLRGTKEEASFLPENEKEFKAVLSSIFSAKKTKHIIDSLRLHLE